jgi:hypothetical protein
MNNTINQLTSQTVNTSRKRSSDAVKEKQEDKENSCGRKLRKHK